jgi:hypothetical protein
MEDYIGPSIDHRLKIETLTGNPQSTILNPSNSQSQITDPQSAAR